MSFSLRFSDEAYFFRSQVFSVVLYVCIGFLAFLGFFVNFPIQDHYLLREIIDYSHVVIFAGLGFWACLKTKRRQLPPLKVFGFLFLVGAVLGGAIELLQKLVGREASYSDFVLDLFGLCIGILFGLSFCSRKLIRSALRYFSFFLFLVSLIFPLKNIFIAVDMQNKFPIIFDGESKLSTLRPYVPVNHAELELVHSPVAWPGQEGSVMSILFRAATTSGISLLGNTTNWVGYQYFFMDVFNPSFHSIDVELRIHDVRHNNQYEDRFNHQYTIPPGVSKIQLLLDFVRQKPAVRPLDFSQISGVILFMVEPKNAVQLYLDNIYLQ